MCFINKVMNKIRNYFKKLDLKNNISTVLMLVVEVILFGDIVLGVIKGVSLFNYICIIVIAMLYVYLAEYNFRRYQNEKNKKQ